MRILLLHPADSPDHGPWANQTWDRIIDLGLGGPNAYQRWSRKFGCPVSSLESLRAGGEDFRIIRELLAAGRGSLLDREGLDWWELTAIVLHQQLETIVLLRRLAAGLETNDQLHATRAGFHVDALQLLGQRAHCFASAEGKRGPRHYLHTISRLSTSQLVDVFWDKYDAGYTFRRRFVRRRKPSEKPVVLLPSAYVNVSRLGLAYANTLPETDFLLVTTRRSGWVANPPANVRVARLAGYAQRHGATAREHADLVSCWRALRRDLASVPEIRLLDQLGLLDSLPARLRQGLAIRDAWRNVIEGEPVRAVLCGDDTNPYTHIPLLLAGKRGIPTLTCHHGAFDGRHLIKRNHADVILAKSRMEQDYLHRVCGVASESIALGAPALPARSEAIGRSGDRESPFITLFSEAYEVSSGRAEEFYRDLLPPLADIALKTNRKLVIKLHPFESRREREGFVTRVLSAEQRRVATVVTGPLTQNLLQNTWFGITVLSTVAMECAFDGVPCFLCDWLEFSSYGYIDQFSKFGVGHRLKSVAEISDIPRILENYSVRPDLVRDLWQPIGPDRFQELLARNRKLDRAIAV